MYQSNPWYNWYIGFATAVAAPVDFRLGSAGAGLTRDRLQLLVSLRLHLALTKRLDLGPRQQSKPKRKCNP